MRMDIPQLILDTEEHNVILPESRNGRYSAQLTPQSESVEMITKRMVLELQGNVWVISYEYNYFKPEMKNRVIAACEKGRRTPITCAFLPPDSDGTLSQSRFWVTKFKYPTYRWSKNVNGTRVPLWGDFSLTLREVEPSD